MRRRREDAGAPSAAPASPAGLPAAAEASASCTEAACTRPLRALRRTGTLAGSLMSACSSASAGIEAVYACPHQIRSDQIRSYHIISYHILFQPHQAAQMFDPQTPRASNCADILSAELRSCKRLRPRVLHQGIHCLC